MLCVKSYPITLRYLQIILLMGELGKWYCIHYDIGLTRMTAGFYIGAHVLIRTICISRSHVLSMTSTASTVEA